MKINLKKLREYGYEIQQSPDSIEIYARDFRPAVEMLQDEFGLERMYAFFVEEEIHEFQILTDIRRAK